jgi:hypothetical protein
MNSNIRALSKIVGKGETPLNVATSKREKGKNQKNPQAPTSQHSSKRKVKVGNLHNEQSSRQMQVNHPLELY